jgi:hypothetical protein
VKGGGARRQPARHHVAQQLERALRPRVARARADERVEARLGGRHAGGAHLGEHVQRQRRLTLARAHLDRRVVAQLVGRDAGDARVRQQARRAEGRARVR